MVSQEIPISISRYEIKAAEQFLYYQEENSFLNSEITHSKKALLIGSLSGMILGSINFYFTGSYFSSLQVGVGGGSLCTLITCYIK